MLQRVMKRKSLALMMRVVCHSFGFPGLTLSYATRIKFWLLLAARASNTLYRSKKLLHEHAWGPWSAVSRCCYVQMRRTYSTLLDESRKVQSPTQQVSFGSCREAKRETACSYKHVCSHAY